MATAEICKCSDEDHAREAMRERDGRVMVGAERCRRAGTDKDQREGADKFGCQRSPEIERRFSHSQHWFCFRKLRRYELVRSWDGGARQC
jgi:hypothetical protein